MMANRKTADISKECVACGCCVKVCPKKAMLVHKGLYAKADEGKCVGCGICVKACPAGVMKITEREGAVV